MIFSGVTSERYKEVVRGMDLDAEIGHRRQLTIEEYELLHERKTDYRSPIMADKRGEFTLVKIGTEATDDRGQRYYRFNE